MQVGVGGSRDWTCLCTHQKTESGEGAGGLPTWEWMQGLILFTRSKTCISHAEHASLVLLLYLKERKLLGALLGF